VELTCPISWQSNWVVWVTWCEVCWNDYGHPFFDGMENDETWMFMYLQIVGSKILGDKLIFNWSKKPLSSLSLGHA
jgi:hypothetical protein